MACNLPTVGVPVSTPSYPAEERDHTLGVGNYRRAPAAVLMSGGEVPGGRPRSRLRLDFFSTLVRISLKVIERG